MLKRKVVLDTVRGSAFIPHLSADASEEGDFSLCLHAPQVKIVQDFFAAGKPVASICHGLQLLAAAGVLENYKLTSYPECAAECLLARVHWEAESVIVDKNLVRAKAWPNHPAWLRAFIELLGAKIKI